MTPIEFAKKNGFEILNIGDGEERQIKGVYCCDLLSIVMSRAKEDDAWITVMGNINAIAVCLLSDASCVIISEGMELDKEALFKAQSQNICVLKTDLSTYNIAILLYTELKDL